MSDQQKIRVEQVTKIFGPSPKSAALKLLSEGASKNKILQKTGHVIGLNNVSFSVEQGEVFVVMGLSGSGKSTLIRCVNRLITPTNGAIYIDNDDIVQYNHKQLQTVRRNKVAMVFQHFGLFPHKTVAYNVAYGLKVRGDLSRTAQQEKAVEALSLVGLKEWGDHYPHNLSGGMQQRVGLARALATDADILLMDEAFSALDPLIRRQMQDELLQLQERLQKTILFITHDLDEALRIGNRVAIMREGAIVQIGTPQDIVTNPSDEYVAQFMADVNSARVLTAEFVMHPPNPITYKQSVKAALKQMEKVGRDYLYVVDTDNMPDGLVRKSYLEELSSKGIDDISKAVIANFPETARFTHLTELYGPCSLGIPIAVVNDTGRLLGVIDPLDVFAALSATEETVSEPETKSYAD